MTTRYVIEYILNTKHEWSVWFAHGKGTKTSPLTANQFLAMDKRRQSGEYVFFSIEVSHDQDI